MTRKLALLGVSAALLLSACTTPAPTGGEKPAVPAQPTETKKELTPEMAEAAQYLTRMAEQQDRLYQVAAPLLIKNAPLCKTHARNLLGFTAKNRYSYPGVYNEAAHLAFGMGDHLQVTGVLAGSGAARAGLQRGDILIAAEGKVLPTGENASTLAGSVFGPLVSKLATIDMSVAREGASKEIPVPVTRACAFGVEIGNADNVNSYADGQRILVTRGMLNFTQSDTELAYVMAKGIAHNMLGHAQAQRQTGTLSSIVANLISVNPDTSMLIGSGGIKAMPAELDANADRLAVYLLARADYDLDGIAAFWQRLAGTHPATVLNGYVANHPATGTRIAAIREAVAEVKAKQSAKKQLIP